MQAGRLRYGPTRHNAAAGGTWFGSANGGNARGVGDDAIAVTAEAG